MEKNKRLYGWSVVAASWLAVFCLFGYRATFSILKVPMSADMGWSQAEVTLGYSFMMMCYAVAAFFSGFILDRWGAKLVYLVGALFGAAGFYVTAQADTLYAYYASYGVLAGVATGMLWVTSTVSVRKWYVGKSYATMWGFAFAGAPMAQVVMSLFVKNSLAGTQGDAWRGAMELLGLLVLLCLLLAALLAKKSPEDYGLAPFGETPAAPGASAPRSWSLGQAYSTYPIWGAILTFLTSMLGEFLIWTQVVSYWTADLGMTLSRATYLYVVIGVVGIFSMPMMGVVADRVVRRSRCEPTGRKEMLIFGPLVGAVACLLLVLQGERSIGLGLVSCVLFAIYWAIVPGGVVGYLGAIYGRATLGKIWGLGTMIVMGSGPFIGPLVGGYMKDATGSYVYSIVFALGAFLVSSCFAARLPLSLKKREEGVPTEEAATV